MSMFKGLSHFARGWQQQRVRQRTEAMLAALPLELQRDVGWPAMDFRPAVETRRPGR